MEELEPALITFNSYEHSYKKLLIEVLKQPIVPNRNQDTYTLFNGSVSADLSEGFPILTGKKMYLKNIVHELKWMLGGGSNTKYLNDNGVSIWNKWADENGNLGPIYGHQMRNFFGVDQIEWVLEELQLPIRSRRAVVSMWNPKDLPNMKLPPCHFAFNFVDINNTLNVAVTMRSLDLFIGSPYDMTFYALLLHLFCMRLNKTPGIVNITAADCHIYTDHRDAVLKYLNNPIYNLPEIKLPDCLGPLNFEPNSIFLKDYKSSEFIKATVHA